MTKTKNDATDSNKYMTKAKNKLKNYLPFHQYM